ncbi:nucleotidyltransferase domain-containing protein [Hymenobacter sp. ASUV-10]|uniref:Nucleotidyltransferase domain-containing protein n=1 Tax=Hymenobacter aranciens TaxID=3063996 RepID=A0ABT9BF03_9BACT|nr:nucleotidyltransferase domain-containing protein [Hymenobacter sp. ASUV-10]MDO7876812.1 nucleotidyltransferase domain-containing protein [Hymenobacter sp. ASUV-10]
MPQLPHSLDYIQQVLAEYFADKPVQRVQVFGSYARGEATAESDLDVLLSRIPGRRLSLFDLGRYQEELEQRLGISIDLGTALSPFSQPHIEPDLRTVYEQAA